MFYALSRFRYTRLMVVLLIAALVAMGDLRRGGEQYVLGGSPTVGGGNQAVSGFVITNTNFDLNDTDPDQLDFVAFSLDTEADEVWVTLTSTGPITSPALPCIEDLVIPNDWECNLTGDSTTATNLIDYSVYASDQAG